MPGLFANGAGYTVSQGYGAYGDQVGYAHGVIDAEASIKALKKLQAEGEGALDIPTLSPIIVAEDNTSDVSVQAFSDLNWQPLAWAAGLLAFVLLTMGFTTMRATPAEPPAPRGPPAAGT